MARKPTVRYFDSRGGYYCQYRGRQHKLAVGPNDSPAGPTYLEALNSFRQLMELGNVYEAKDRNAIRAVLETYLRYAKTKLAPRTMERRLLLMRQFCDVHGERAVGDLKHDDVYRFIEDMRRPRSVGRNVFRWGDGSAANLIAVITTAFNWAVKTKLILVNPISGIDSPTIRSRSRECLVTPEQHQAILASCHATTLRNMITALENTGARPGELIGATAMDWRDDVGAIVYHRDDVRREDEFRHKTAAKKGRTIYFTGDALRMVRGLVAKHQSGPLFRTIRGSGYSVKSFCQCFQPIKRRMNMPKLTPYSYRHTLATAWLMAGKPIEILAEILGNTPETIRKHYSHLTGDRAGIRAHLEAFRGGKN